MVQTKEKTALDVMNEVSQATETLRLIPSIIMMTIEKFGLDQVELTDDAKKELVDRHEILSDSLYMTLSTITDALKKLETITE